MPNIAQIMGRSRLPGELIDECRALGAYYRAGDTEHPDHELTEHYILERSIKFYESDDCRREFRKCIRFANSRGTLAVFMFQGYGMRRLKSWPESVENGTAQTEKAFISEHSQSDSYNKITVSSKADNAIARSRACNNGSSASIPNSLFKL